MSPRRARSAGPQAARPGGGAASFVTEGTARCATATLPQQDRERSKPLRSRGPPIAKRDVLKLSNIVRSLTSQLRWQAGRFAATSEQLVVPLFELARNPNPLRKQVVGLPSPIDDPAHI